MVVSAFVATAATTAKVVALAKAMCGVGSVLVAAQPLADRIRNRRSRSSR